MSLRTRTWVQPVTVDRLVRVQSLDALHPLVGGVELGRGRYRRSGRPRTEISEPQPTPQYGHCGQQTAARGRSAPRPTRARRRARTSPGYIGNVADQLPSRFRSSARKTLSSTQIRDRLLFHGRAGFLLRALACGRCHDRMKATMLLISFRAKSDKPFASLSEYRRIPALARPRAIVARAGSRRWRRPRNSGLFRAGAV